MTRTTNEQQEQVARYLEILHAQQDRSAVRAEFMKVTSWGAVTGFVVSLLAVTLAFFADENSNFSVWVVVALVSSLLGSLTTGLLVFFRIGIRARQTSERLTSLAHDEDTREQ